MNRFKEQLRRQLRFLYQSTQSFDNGHGDEAVRIAMSVRVLCHDTRHSTSILKHLEAKDIELLSTCKPVPERLIKNASLYEGLVQITPHGRVPKLGNGPTNYLIPFDQWWKQIVMVPENEEPFTRKDLVLTTANKDGGAHVDANLTAQYEKVVEGYAEWVTEDDEGQEISVQLRNMHFPCLRQIAFELLHSPGIKALLD